MISKIWWPHPLATSNAVLEREEILRQILVGLKHIGAMLERDLQRNKSIFNHTQIHCDETR